MKKIESVRGRERKPEIDDYVYTHTEKTMRTRRARNTIEHVFLFWCLCEVLCGVGVGVAPKSAVGFVFYAPGFRTLGGWGFWLESVLSFFLSKRDILSSLRE